MKFIINKMSLFYESTTFKMKRLENMHVLLVKESYDNEKREHYTEVFIDDVPLQKYEG